MPTSSIPRLLVRYPIRRALLANARTHGSVLSLFVPGRTDVPVGATVMVDITLDDSVLSFQLTGKVDAQRIPQAGSRLEAGLGIVFTGDQKRAAAHMLAACAGRSLDNGTAIDSRQPVDLSCLVRFGASKQKAAVKDVSQTGAFIGSPRLKGLHENLELTINISPILGLFGGRRLRARVIWVGEKKGIRGFGVRFLEQANYIRDSLKKHLKPASPV